MKTDLTSPGPKTLPQNLAKPAGAMALKDKDALKKTPDVKVPEQKPSPDYKVELSSPKPSTPSLPSVETPKVESIAKDKIQEEVKSEVIKKVEVKEGSVKKPAVFFIKGLNAMSSPSKSEGSYAGLGRMAEAVEGSRLYGWDQKKEMIDEIKKVHPDFPIVLVGHSLGGDTAIEIADELDSLEHKFRPVDLLVTIDAFGFGNDIVPQNVKKHVNIFGENNFFLNDGPHVARRHEKTSVENILSPLDHTDLDDSKELQFEIMNSIQKALGKKS